MNIGRQLGLLREASASFAPLCTTLPWGEHRYFQVSLSYYLIDNRGRIEVAFLGQPDRALYGFADRLRAVLQRMRDGSGDFQFAPGISAGNARFETRVPAELGRRLSCEESRA